MVNRFFFKHHFFILQTNYDFSEFDDFYEMDPFPSFTCHEFSEVDNKWKMTVIDESNYEKYSEMMRECGK